MANIINRFRRKEATPQSSSPNTEPADVDDNNVSTLSEKGVGPYKPAINPLEPKTNQSYDPELAIGPTVSEEESAIEEDLKDIPVEVRSTVSFEDDQDLPTITFRYFLLSFLFIAPGAFLYQMVPNNFEASGKHPVLTVLIGPISYNLRPLFSLFCSNRFSLRRSVAGKSLTSMGS